MNQPLVSVILPFLNGGPAFAPALRSVLDQSYQKWELLLCDDGSSDGSLQYAQSLRDPRITVWSDGLKKGLAGRLNECLDRAQGELVARMDADDISYPHRLRDQVACLAERPEIDVVGCRMLVFDQAGQALGKRPLPLEHGQIVEDPASGFGLAHPTWMARAAWYQRHRYDPTALRFEDVELLYRAYENSRFANLPQLLYGYREMKGGFQKRLKTRVGRIRYLHARRVDTGLSLFYRAAVLESTKVLADAALAATGTRYAMLRRREEPLSAAESAEWESLFAHFATPSGAELISKLESAKA